PTKGKRSSSRKGMSLTPSSDPLPAASSVPGATADKQASLAASNGGLPHLSSSALHTAGSIARPKKKARAIGGGVPEIVIESLIRLCGWSAILFVFGIFFFVFREGAPFLFSNLDFKEFFTSSDWNPVSDTPHYGILGLLAGTVSVSLLAMA